ncbi:MAG: CsbD family protein [Bryobacterales bacterium]|nr:CsbD family protein [Bryobacterales bacterium]
MNWDQIEGNWTHFRGKVREHWGRLTDDDLDIIAGRRDQLIGRIQYTYGLLKEAAEAQVRDFENKLKGFVDQTRSFVDDVKLKGRHTSATR